MDILKQTKTISYSSQLSPICLYYVPNTHHIDSIFNSLSIMPILLCNKIGEREFFDQEHTKWLPQIVNWEWTRVIKIELSPLIIDSIKNNRNVCIKNVNPLFSEHHLIDLLFIMDCGVRSSVIYLLKEQVGLYHINSSHIFTATKKSSAMLFLSKSLCLVLSRSSLP